MQLYYCFMCNSFHAGTRQFCHILFMLVSGVLLSYFVFNGCNEYRFGFCSVYQVNLLFPVQIFSCCYKTVLSHSVDDGSAPLLVAECYLTMSV